MARTDREGANPTTPGQAPRMPAGLGGVQGEAASGPVGEALTSRELLLVDALAERVLMLLEPVLDGADASRPSHLVDARMLSRQLGVSRDTVYEHAEALGGRRIGNGPRGRLRFDLDVALASWTHRSSRRDPTDRKPGTTTPNTRSGRQHPPPSAARLLPVHGAPIDLAADEGS
jgi:hypothetical protein